MSDDSGFGGLHLAVDEVEDIVSELPVSEEVEDRATEFARRADLHHPINRSSKAVAGGAVYLAALLVNEKVTQAEVGDAADVSELSVRDAYPEIAKHDGIPLEHRSKSSGRDSRKRFKRIKEAFGL